METQCRDGKPIMEWYVRVVSDMYGWMDFILYILFVFALTVIGENRLDSGKKAWTYFIKIYMGQSKSNFAKYEAE